MIRILLLCFALLVSSLAAPSAADAARIGGYAKAKAKGRIYTHRPNYKRYKGYKFAKRHSRSKSGRVIRAKAPARTTHTTKRY